jgi:hypothetical protein
LGHNKVYIINALRYKPVAVKLNKLLGTPMGFLWTTLVEHSLVVLLVLVKGVLNGMNCEPLTWKLEQPVWIEGGILEHI